MERPSRSKIFRDSMRLKKEENKSDNVSDKTQKLPIHKARMVEGQEKIK